MARVLLFCPTHRLCKETINSIHGIQYDGALDTLFTRDNPHGAGSGQNIIYNYQKAERIVKAENYDYLFTVEQDMIVPPDALSKLMALDADIAYGVYCFRKGKPTINITRTDKQQESYGLYHNLRDWRKVFGKPVDCNGLGFGCTLIKRSVFDVLNFHSVPGHDGDTQLAHDAKRLGLKQMADTSVLCGHKRPDGTVVWPDADGGHDVGVRQPVEKRTIIPNQSIAYWDELDVSHILRSGEPVDVDFENASVFVTAGMAVYG